ncbi:hypothetical protein SPRG_10657 [Saprolegnia parasitica CBS 223.65]|uniref:PH domain-containing protein n=1 Tax=Saprolegnia parasitica (strain CBS 223.65) TaxID=695850 RepID=A0A067CBN4_SAPPC|nr:hypothetical protein SPRG_10657 [Saprolegnia parasitica CBS 223.65]KDO23961.1 hypothetical protein SPRG_10657 [Saprolegnia parasitica CBS 223.65]|eukprot:XP_012205283.1 hypothetical protein SPRG_10657 [Saprolegnia parasitica CBS 223.65]
MATSLKYSANVEVQAKNWLGLTTWKFQNWALDGSSLTIAHASCLKRDADSTVKYTVVRGGAWSGQQFGLRVQTIENGEIFACATSKTAWAMWLNAFFALDAKHKLQTSRDSTTSTTDTQASDDERSITDSPPRLTKKVSFSGDVRVRMIEPRQPTEPELNAKFALQAAIFSC